MTTDGMVKYLEEKGFGVSKTYDSKKKVYRFAIAKDNTTLTKEFTYQDWLKHSLVDDLEGYQEDWLDEFVGDFKKKRYYVNDIDATASLSLARHFMNEMNELANSSDQVLVGDLTTGYTYVPHSVKSMIDDYVDSKLKSVIKNEKGKENMATSSSITMKIASSGISANKINYSSMFGCYSKFDIDNVIFNDPATIVFWKDGSKTVVKAENEIFDPEKGLAMAIAKKAYGNQGNHFNEIKKWTGDTRVGDPMKDPDVIDFVKEADRMLLNRCNKNWTKEMLITDAKTALKDIDCAIGICVDKYHVSVPYDIWFAQKVLYEALTDANRRKATIISAMDRASTFLDEILGE